MSRLVEFGLETLGILFVVGILIVMLANITASALWLAGIGAYLISFIVHLFL